MAKTSCIHALYNKLTFAQESFQW